MGQIFLTSDLHFCHDRAFIYEPRGFKSVYEMNEAIIKRAWEVMSADDDFYILGDLMLKDDETGLKLINQLPGRKFIIIGNHDTEKRINEYTERIHNLEMIQYATRLNYRGYHFYLSHYPTMTGNLEHESLKQMTLNLSGHTHSKDKFYQDIPYVYNVALDAHNCYPVLIDDVIEDMKTKVRRV